MIAGSQQGQVQAWHTEKRLSNVVVSLQIISVVCCWLATFDNEKKCSLSPTDVWWQAAVEAAAEGLR